MIKFKYPVKRLGSTIALCLCANLASADSVYSTYHYLFTPDGTPIHGALSGTDTLNNEGSDKWLAGYFFVNPKVCSNGCDLTGVSLQFDGSKYSPFESTSLAGMKLEIFSNVASSSTNIGKDLGTALFQLNSPSSVTFNGSFGTKIQFSANTQDQSAPALLQPNTAYWLKLTNVDQNPELGWFYNGNPSNEFWLAHYDPQGGEGSPYIFEIMGTNSTTPRLVSPPLQTPIPGAIWMMGSALIGLMSIRHRNKLN